MIISELLQDDYTTFTSTNIYDGLEILKNNEISLILLDVVMPDVDGYDSCKMIKEHDEYKEIPIIFATAQNEVQFIEKAFDVGGVDYIVKPVRKSEVLVRVKNHLKIYNQRKALESKNEEITRFLKQQTKMSLMGEMIGNIAHQWRQPLNYMNTSASYMAMLNQMDNLDKEHIDDTMKSFISKINYLSETIDTFRNFVKEDKELIDVNIKDTLRGSIDLVQSVLKDNFIEAKVDFQDVKLLVKAPFGELSQVFINILNNAKDVIVERKVDKPWICISLKEHNSNAVITFEDNAGGIPEDYLSKIFDSKFTTKGNNGTGLGLHMSKQIVEESLKGSIQIQNTSNGAKFTISIPTSES